MRHACRRLLGMLLSKLRLHRVAFAANDGIDVVHKRRKVWATWVISPGNLFLKLTGSSIVVLPSSRWIAWELAVDAARQRNLVSTAGGNAIGLSCRRIPGQSLAQILAHHHVGHEQKSAALRWSLLALNELHRHVADWGDGIVQSISHGDATANNVIVNLDNGTACWIDFDTRHHPSLTEADRRTDDLRALIYSAAVHWPATRYLDLAEILIESQPECSTLRHLHARLQNEWCRMTTAQLAQAPLQWSQASALRDALLQALGQPHDASGL